MSLRKYEQYVELQWWEGIEKRNIRNWIQNFGLEDKDENEHIAELILKQIIFYNKKQLVSYTRYLVNELKSEIYVSQRRERKGIVSDEELEKLWIEKLNTTKIMPGALEGDSSGSAHVVARFWKQVLGDRDSQYSDISNIVEDYQNGVRTFILVEDFSGSGNQLCNVLKRKVSVENQKVAVGKLAAVLDDIEIIVAVYAIHKRAIKEIKDEFPAVRLMYVDLLTDEMSYLSQENRNYENMNENDRLKVINLINKINTELVSKKAEYQKLSSYVLNIPIIFSHGCPNNTLLLLFARTEQWNPLFEKEGE